MDEAVPWRERLLEMPGVMPTRALGTLVLLASLAWGAVVLFLQREHLASE